MIRISTHQEQGCTVVIIDGQVSEADEAEIQRVRSSLTGEVVLKLAGLTACTDDGVKVLQSWLDEGARLQDATLFLRMVLHVNPAAK